MLSQEIFKRGMGILAEAYHREPSEDSWSMYYQILQNKVTDEQFTRAVKYLLETDIYPNFPKPSVIITHAEAFKGNPSDSLHGRHYPDNPNAPALWARARARLEGRYLNASLEEEALEKIPENTNEEIPF